MSDLISAMIDETLAELSTETTEPVKTRKPRPSGMKYKCGFCGEMGHNARTCPTLHPALAMVHASKLAAQTVQEPASMLLDSRGMPIGTERLVTLLLAK